MKIIFCLLGLFAFNSIVFAKEAKPTRKPSFYQDHIQLSPAAKQVVDGDACTLVAVEATFEYLSSKMSDPSDLDTLNVKSITAIKPKQNYAIQASINNGSQVKSYQVTATCVGKVASEK